MKIEISNTIAFIPISFAFEFKKEMMRDDKEKKKVRMKNQICI
jgi:hypothetical protein